MTEPNRLDLLDTDYAALIATDYDPNLERLIRAAGESSRDAVLLTRLVGLAQKPLETERDWQQFEAVWGKLESDE
ncbi:hypothetical protein NG796_16665 [Laspinema sp. A4]|uniref:hypothetical protein n=1 Tax=Laspinema sp. D2d TaxID=2953686 RepID=UPI0021BB7E69|nr:hypothetical protein [Laspinema sp. D2d]MCT7984905.1 hypothetical protein [Laspinema sp. D2d]